MAAPGSTAGGMPLLDAVKQGSASLASPNGPQAAQMGLQPTTGEQTAAVQKAVSVGQTGKDLSSTAGGVAGLSSIAERLASMNTVGQAAALSQQGALQSEAQIQQADAQQQQFAQQAGMLTQQRLDMRASFTDKLNGMLQQSAEQINSLSLADNRSRAEQMGVMMRLSSDQYVTQLTQTATRARLNDAATFQTTLAETVFD